MHIVSSKKLSKLNWYKLLHPVDWLSQGGILSVWIIPLDIYVVDTIRVVQTKGGGTQAFFVFTKMYIGSTKHMVHIRILQHLRAIARDDKTYPVARHNHEKHGGKANDLVYYVIDSVPSNMRGGNREQKLSRLESQYIIIKYQRIKWSEFRRRTIHKLVMAPDKVSMKLFPLSLSLV